MSMMACHLLLASFVLATPNADVVADGELTAIAGELIESLERAERADRFRSKPQKEQLLRPLDHPDRRDWSYWPRERSGLALSEMTAEQRQLTQRLLGAVMSAQGQLKVMHIVLLEDVLRATESFGLNRDAGDYRLTLFGRPAVDAPWSFRFEGHHVSINVTVAPAALSVTPSFLGANPSEVNSGLLTGLRPLRLEEELGRRLARSLGAGQEAGRGSAPPPVDVLTGQLGKERSEWEAWRQAVEPEGLPVAEMRDDQKALVEQILDEVLGNYRPRVRAAARKKIDAGALRFLWLGGVEDGAPHYYRLQGGSFVFEVDNVQGDGTHIHTVWRDRTSDFGDDPLRRHYAEHHDAPAPDARQAPGPRP